MADLESIRNFVRRLCRSDYPPEQDHLFDSMQYAVDAIVNNTPELRFELRLNGDDCELLRKMRIGR